MGRVIFSSDQLPGRRDGAVHSRQLTELFSDHLCAADLSFFDDRPARSRAAFIKFGQLTVTELNATIQSATRTKRHVAADNRGDYIVGTMLNGTRSLIRQNGREAVRDVGQTILYTNAATIDARHDAPVMFRGVTVPAALLVERVPNFEDIAVTPIVPSQALNYLQGYMSFLLGSDDASASLLNESVSDHLLDLVVLVLGASGDSADLAKTRGLRAVRLREAIAALERHACEQDFSSDKLADGLGISRRYLSDILFESGATFTERILELRLQRVRAMLSNPAFDHMKVLDIACECGFNDISHFNRRFRARFGCSPIQFRGRA